MSAHATQPERDDPGHQAQGAQTPDAQAASAQRHHQVLDGLINIGADFARLLHSQALLQAQPAPQPGQPPATHPKPAPAPSPAPGTLVDLAAAFGTISRAVRRCIMLAQALANPKQPAAPANDPARHRTAVRKRIIREVEDAIHRTANEGASAERLTAELRERLDAPDLEDDINSRPVADIIRELCRDLGLFSAPNDPQWKRRTPAIIEQLCARAAQPSRPRHPSPMPQDAGPSAAQPSPAGQPPPDPPLDGHPASSPQPADTPRAPSNLQVGHRLPRHWPDNPAEPAAPQRHATRNGDRWHPPPPA